MSPSAGSTLKTLSLHTNANKWIGGTFASKRKSGACTPPPGVKVSSFGNLFHAPGLSDSMGGSESTENRNALNHAQAAKAQTSKKINNDHIVCLDQLAEHGAAAIKLRAAHASWSTGLLFDEGSSIDGASRPSVVVYRPIRIDSCSALCSSNMLK
jgi:hypothetical protein